MKKVWIFNILFFIAKVINVLLITPLCIVLFFIIYFFVLMVKKGRKKRQKPNLVWGAEPLINNKYYSLALGQNYNSVTLMNTHFSVINKRKDFDIYYDDLFPLLRKTKGLWYIIHFIIKSNFNYFLFLYTLLKYDIFHHSFIGGYLSYTWLHRLEAQLLKWAGCKTVILGYGADFYKYSEVKNLSWTHTLLVHYPKYAKIEKKIAKRVNYWVENADIIVNGMQVDGLGRWDVLPYRAEVIDLNVWDQKNAYSNCDGKNGVVYIVHAPNHRYIKGTEYLINAVETLNNEGLEVELIILEKLQNDEVRDILTNKADIFFDQINLGYAMSAIEGFAVGLPVMTNLTNEEYVRVFRRYSYLNECPAISTNHENLIDNLRALVQYPELRKSVGTAGRQFAEKYHSYKMANYVFEKVYNKIWNGRDEDLLNIFHPLVKESYNNQSPLVVHPLKEGNIPEKYLNKLE